MHIEEKAIILPVCWIYKSPYYLEVRIVNDLKYIHHFLNKTTKYVEIVSIYFTSNIVNEFVDCFQKYPRPVNYNYCPNIL